MLRWRLILGTVIIAALAGLCWADTVIARPGMILFAIALVVARLAAGEMVGLLSTREPKPQPGIVYAGTLTVVGFAGVPLFYSAPIDCPVGTLGWPLLGLALAVLLAFLGEMRRYVQPGEVLGALSKSILAIVYVGLLLSFAIALRLLGGASQGMLALVSMIAVVKMCDVGAYTFGRLFGRNKLAPVLSPGKTWEGAIGGVATACLTAFVIFQVIAPRLELASVTGEDRAASIWGWMVYGTAIAAAGMVGDLAESLIKRDAGRKDSSAWMPGFGGVLDLLDSILAAAPVAYVCWTAGIVGM